MDTDIIYPCIVKNLDLQNKTYFESNVDSTPIAMATDSENWQPVQKMQEFAINLGLAQSQYYMDQFAMYVML